MIINLVHHRLLLFETKNRRICKRGDKACDAKIYRALVLALRKGGIWPEMKIHDIRISIEDLTRVVTRMDIPCRNSYIFPLAPEESSSGDISHLNFAAAADEFHETVHREAAAASDPVFDSD